MMALISGCSHKTTISEASNHLDIKSQQILISSYVERINGMKETLTAIAPELKVTENPKPVSVQPELSTFLSTNDCTATADKDGCYVRTRLVLIKMSRRIDFLSSRLFVAKGTVNNLVNNLNEVITGLYDVRVPQPKK